MRKKNNSPTKVGTLFTQLAKFDDGKLEYFKEVSIVSQEVINAVFDGDLHTRIQNVEFSTSPREVITIGEMMEGNELNECSRNEKEIYS